MRKTRFLAGILTASILASTMSISAFAIDKVAEDKLDTLPTTENGDRSYPYSDGVVLNKTAMITGGKYGPADVTLSITGTNSSDNPDHDDSAPIIVEFVVDATSSLFATGSETDDTATADQWVNSMISQLSGKNAHVGLTLFTNEAKVAAPISADVLTAENADALKAQVTKTELYKWGVDPANLGTNIESGIEAGARELENFTLDKYPNARKYLVLITDGGAFWWDGADNVKKNSTYKDGETVQYAQNNMAAERALKGTALTYADVTALLAAPATQMDDAYAIDGTLSDLVSDVNTYPVTDFEKGVYAASKAIDAIPNTINLITVGYPYYNAKAELKPLTDLANSFLVDKCAVKGDLIQAKSATDTAALVQLMSVINEDSKDPSSDVVGSMKTVIAAGSVVTDIIGKGAEKNNASRLYDFDVDTAKEFTYKFNDVSISATLDADNKIAFTKDGKIYAELTYVKGDEATGDNEEYFTLKINDAITLTDKVSLTYTVNLETKSTASGSHSLDINNQATLAHKTSSGAEHIKLFPVPAYAYSESSGGGGGGGSSSGGSSSKPQVNKDDHYAYVVGYPDGTVRPRANITREEVATIFFRLLTDESRAAAWTTSNNFPDVVSSRWSNNAISTAYKAQIISGYPNGTFRPSGNITRAEFATIAAKFSDQAYKGGETFIDTKGHWAHDYIEIAVQEGWISGYEDGTFRPNVEITRAEAMTLINAVLSRKPDANHMVSDMIHWPDNSASAWYYAQVQEATNSHDYEKRTSYDETEVWTKIIPTRDWKALEDPNNNQYLDSDVGDVTK